MGNLGRLRLPLPSRGWEPPDILRRGSLQCCQALGSLPPLPLLHAHAGPDWEPSAGTGKATPAGAPRGAGGGREGGAGHCILQAEPPRGHVTRSPSPGRSRRRSGPGCSPALQSPAAAVAAALQGLLSQHVARVGLQGVPLLRAETFLCPPCPCPRRLREGTEVGPAPPHPAQTLPRPSPPEHHAPGDSSWQSRGARSSAFPRCSLCPARLGFPEKLQSLPTVPSSLGWFRQGWSCLEQGLDDLVRCLSTSLSYDPLLFFPFTLSPLQGWKGPEFRQAVAGALLWP